MKSIYWIVLLLTMAITVPVFAFSPCLTSTNGEHETFGRGVQAVGARGEGFYALGSSDFLGSSSAGFSSLYESSGIVGGIVAYYEAYEPIDFFHVEGSTYGVTFYSEQYCCCFVVEFEASAWAMTECDMDEDGMDDRWEHETLGGTEQGAEDDLDNDSVNNYYEYMMGTDASDPQSTPSVGNYYKYDELGRIKSILRAN